jgi:signal recognition particle GTPase
MEADIVFEITDEKGTVSINRVPNKYGNKLIYYLNDYASLSDLSEAKGKGEYNSFEQPFQLIDNKYTWYMMEQVIVHVDFRKYVIEKLIERLNSKSVSPAEIFTNKEYLEDCLKIKLISSIYHNKSNLQEITINYITGKTITNDYSNYS